MELCLTYDMRAPSFGAQRNYLFDAAIDQTAWADELGFDLVGLGEHHSAEDGYNPSPLPLACAMAARSHYIKLRTSVLLAPLYDLPKLAEDASISQIISNGRLILGIGGGYRPAEFETFGRDLDSRWKDVADAVEFLRRAWQGEEFEWEGRHCRITPKPEPFAPPILLGGSSKAAARRAARIADGWLPPLDPGLWQPYRDERIRMGCEDPGPYPSQGPIFLWVSHNPEGARKRILPHVRHQLHSYSQWTREAFGKAAGPYAQDVSDEDVFSSNAYQVLTPEQALALCEELGNHSTLYLSPLLAGIDPKLSWRMLRIFEEEVLPYLPRGEESRQRQFAETGGDEPETARVA